MKSYGQYCPVAQAAEILSQRWTLLILRDVLSGARRFNEIRQFVPLMSPTLLSQRLKQLEGFGLLERKAGRGRGTEYHPTPAAEELRGVIELLGAWGQRWVRNRVAEQRLDVNLLMSTIHSLIDPRHFPARRVVIAVSFTDRPLLRKGVWRVDRWWLVLDGESSELCLKDPGHEIDAYVKTDLRTLTRYFMGDLAPREALQAGSLQVTGAPALVRTFSRWMPRSRFGSVALPPAPLDLPAILRAVNRTPERDSTPNTGGKLHARL